MFHECPMYMRWSCQNQSNLLSVLDWDARSRACYDSFTEDSSFVGTAGTSLLLSLHLSALLFPLAEHTWRSSHLWQGPIIQKTAQIYNSQICWHDHSPSCSCSSSTVEREFSQITPSQKWFKTTERTLSFKTATFNVAKCTLWTARTFDSRECSAKRLAVNLTWNSCVKVKTSTYSTHLKRGNKTLHNS